VGLRIFETDPESAPKPRFSEDLVGRFRSGYQINNRPMSLEKWRVTTGDPEVADAVHDMLGGQDVQEWEATGEDNLELFTDSTRVKVWLEGPNALRQGMALWGRNGKAIRRCDGVEQTGEGAEGNPCVCPASYAERKQAAKDGTGCEPGITIYFKFADDLDLGKFKFQTGSWSFVKDVMAPEAKLAQIDGPALAWLGLEPVEFTTKTGVNVKYTKPTLEIIGAAPSAGGFADDEPPF
jgi:hypothetical protein